MRTLNETDAFMEAKERYRFEGTKRYDTEKLDAFLDGFEHADKQLKPLFVEFKDWCDKNEHDLRLDNMNRHDRGAITTKELFDLWVESKPNK